MTIDLVNILDKNCPLRTPEMAFQRIKSSKFSGGECPQTILAARPFSTGLIKKISWLFLLLWNNFCILLSISKDFTQRIVNFFPHYFNLLNIIQLMLPGLEPQQKANPRLNNS